MLMYVDDIIVTRNNLQFIASLITKLSKEFVVKELRYLKYFLGIEVHKCTNGLILSQGKYATDILAKAKMLDASYF